MNISQIATALVLRELRCFSLKLPEDKTLLQTKVFLAQDIGIPLGFGFSWHIAGPYSPDPTRTIQQYEQRQKDINKAHAERIVVLSKVLYCRVDEIIEKER